MKKRFTILAILLFGLTGTTMLLKSFAASVTLSLSPSSQSIVVGNNFTVSVRVNSGSDTVNAVQANISYPADKLDFVSLSAAGSAFEIQAENSGGGGNIRIGRGTLTPSTGDKLVAKITFKAKVSSGSASVTFNGDSAVVKSSDGTNALTGTNGGNYSFAAATTTKPSPITSPTTPSTKPNNNSSPTPTPGTENTADPVTSPVPGDAKPPKISKIVLSNVSFKSATISWQTDEPSSSVVNFGTSEQYGSVAQAEGLTTAHNVNLPADLLAVGTTHHYQVVSADANGNEATSKDATFATVGIPLQLLVLNAAGQPVDEAEVNVNGVTKKTDQIGTVFFENMPSGVLGVSIKVNNKEYQRSIAVQVPSEDELQAGAAGEQQFAISLKEQSKLPLIIGLGLGGLILASLIALGIRRFRRRPPGPSIPNQTPDIMPIQQPPTISPNNSTSEVKIFYPDNSSNDPPRS